eukprot:9545095-Prorocentrum_lima.AAC.1
MGVRNLPVTTNLGLELVPPVPSALDPTTAEQRGALPLDDGGRDDNTTRRKRSGSRRKRKHHRCKADGGDDAKPAKRKRQTDHAGHKPKRKRSGDAGRSHTPPQ